jgi:hypothetical protein
MAADGGAKFLFDEVVRALVKVGADFDVGYAMGVVFGEALFPQPDATALDNLLHLVFVELTAGSFTDALIEEILDPGKDGRDLLVDAGGILGITWLEGELRIPSPGSNHFASVHAVLPRAGRLCVLAK